MSLLFVLLSFSSFAGVEFYKFNSAIKISVQKGSASFICSAVAYNSNTLITAAHCLDGASSVTAFGETSSNFQIHPKYSQKLSNFRYDIAKIHLTNKISRRISIYPIRPIDRFSTIYRVGFGGRYGSNKLTVIYPIYVSENFHDYFKSNDEYSYSGDSGGPLYQWINGEYSLVGIHSTIESSNTAYNVKLVNFIKWLDS